MPKLYQYTIYRQSGETEVLPPCPKKSFNDDLYDMLQCRTITMVPKDFLGDGMNKRASYYTNDEGRIDETNHRNPHFKVLRDAIFDEEWDIVGDVVCEEVSH